MSRASSPSAIPLRASFSTLPTELVSQILGEVKQQDEACASVRRAKLPPYSQYLPDNDAQIEYGRRSAYGGADMLWSYWYGRGIDAMSRVSRDLRMLALPFHVEEVTYKQLANPHAPRYLGSSSSLALEVRRIVAGAWYKKPDLRELVAAVPALCSLPRLEYLELSLSAWQAVFGGDVDEEHDGAEHSDGERDDDHRDDDGHDTADRDDEEHHDEEHDDDEHEHGDLRRREDARTLVCHALRAVAPRLRELEVVGPSFVALAAPLELFAGADLRRLKLRAFDTPFGEYSAELEAALLKLGSLETLDLDSFLGCSLDDADEGPIKIDKGWSRGFSLPSVTTLSYTVDTPLPHTILPFLRTAFANVSRLHLSFRDSGPGNDLTPIEPRPVSLPSLRRLSLDPKFDDVVLFGDAVVQRLLNTLRTSPIEGIFIHTGRELLVAHVAGIFWDDLMLPPSLRRIQLVRSDGLSELLADEGHELYHLEREHRGVEFDIEVPPPSPSQNLHYQFHARCDAGQYARSD
ncbi:hypothetical protein JCM10449v2_004929 [Rhodotorula kratochvilovae]